MAARHALEHDDVRDDVAGLATVDQADVRDGFLVDASEVHRSDSLRGHLDSADALLRLDARMRLTPPEGDRQVDRRR
ncbi:MAG TPA: hypothetical protein VFN43_11055 [Humibacillus sp.]|nr:hypothetical protein [Humibacillus sp.]